MASLVNKDSYLQKLAKKICTQEAHEPRKRKFGTGLGEDGTQPKKKKKKKKQKKLKMQGKAVDRPLEKQAAPGGSQASPAKPTNASVKKSGPVIIAATSSSGSQTGGEKGDRSQSDNAGGGDKSSAGSFSAMNLLRQRLHEKIQEISGQGNAKELSPAVLEKRQRRKYERERKKRRRKELRMKEKTVKKEAEEASAAAISEPQAPKNDTKGEIVFNKVEVHEEGLSKAEKRKALKGNITPLTGKNYKQLLSRLESRKSKLEDLKDKDEGKAKELEVKMKWTNVLYKAEGVKIRDDEDRLKAALKRKEKRKAQRQRQWEKRTENVVKKMQQRQDKRRKNLQKKKMAKVEKKKAKARKKGRILPEELEKANFK